MLYVVKIVLHSFAQSVFSCNFPPKSVDLSPASDPRLNPHSPGIQLVPLCELDVMSNGMRPGPDKRHLSAQDIHELRQLIDIEFPKIAADGGHAGITALSLDDDVAIVQCRHGSKLPYEK